MRAVSSGVPSKVRASLPPLICSFSAPKTSSSFWKLLLPLLRPFCAFSSRRSIISRSAMMSSRLMISISRSGSGAALDMGHIRIIKAADDMDDGIRIADVREEFIAQTLALARALDQPRDIDKFDDRRRKLLRLVLIP